MQKMGLIQRPLQQYTKPEWNEKDSARLHNKELPLNKKNDKSVGGDYYGPHAPPNHGEHHKNLKKKTRYIGETTQKADSLTLPSSHQLVKTLNAQPTGEASPTRDRTRHSPTMKIQSPRTYRRWISFESGSKEKTRSGREGSFLRRRDQRQSKHTKNTYCNFWEKKDRGLSD